MLRPILPFALAAVILGGLFLRVDIGEIAKELKGADLAWLPLVLAAGYTSDLFRSLRWQHLLSPIKRPRLFLLFAAAQLGSAVNLMLPLRAGEAVRVRVVSRRGGVEPSSLVGSIFGEVMSDLVSFCAYIIAGVFLLEEARFLWPLAIATGIAVVIGCAGGFVLAGRSESWPDPRENRRPGARAWVEREVYSFARGLQSFRDPGAAFSVLWTAQGIWLFEAVLFYACGRSIGLDLSPGAYLLIVVVANISGSLPITQAGFGVFEVTLTGFIVALGADETQAAAYAIFVHVLLTLPHVVAGPLAALALRLKPADVLFFVRPREEEAA